MLMSLLLALALTQAAPAPPPTDCSLYSIEGIRLGMTAEEAIAASPPLTRLDESALVDERPRPDGSESRHLELRLREGRVVKIIRGYAGMAQGGVRDAFIARFGQPTDGGGRPLTPAQIGDLDRSHTLAWLPSDCNARLGLAIEGEANRSSDRPPAATVILETRSLPAKPSTGPVNVKF